MISGANSGIGLVTAMFLAKKGATVHLVCRNQERGESAKTEITRESSNEKVHLHLLDLSKPKDISKFTRDFVDSGQQLDVLVNNAGCMVNERELTDDGLEKNFATNTLGTYLLTTGLIPVLEKSSDPRVITVSSGGMLVTKLDPHDLQFQNYRNFDGTFAYAQNKRQQVVMARQWALQWPDIHFSSMHPGWADTPAVRQAMPEFRRRMGNRLRSPEEGADTIIWLCVSNTIKDQPSGGFFQDRAAASEHLPLAWTRSSLEDETLLMTKLKEIAERFSDNSSTAAEPSPQSQEN
jgi:dehydrogenase/reductase SDR family protein 12